MERANHMKNRNGIRMIYGMMIVLTLFILMSLVIDAEAITQGPAAVSGNPSDYSREAVVSNVDADESGIGGNAREGKVIQVPIEKRHEAPKEMIARADAYLKALLGEDYVNQFIVYDESYKERGYIGPTDLNPPSYGDVGDSKESKFVDPVGDIVDARELTKEEKEELENQPPIGCTSWFDGCNTCKIVDGKIGACTKKQCTKYEKSRCLVYSRQGQSKPATTKGADLPGREDIPGREGAAIPFQKLDVPENRWVIVYKYNFKVQGPVDPMARIIRVILDDVGNVAGYDGPEGPYQFKLGVDDVKRIARKAGMETPNEAFIRPGWMGWLADEVMVLGEGRASILWQVVDNNAEVGTPEIVYVHPDTGEVLGILTKQEEQYLLFGSVGAPLPEAGADSQQKATSAAFRMNEKVKAELAKLRSGVPEVDKRKMEKFLREEKYEGRRTNILERILTFFASIFG